MVLSWFCPGSKFGSECKNIKSLHSEIWQLLNHFPKHKSSKNFFGKYIIICLCKPSNMV